MSFWPAALFALTSGCTGSADDEPPTEPSTTDSDAVQVPLEPFLQTVTGEPPTNLLMVSIDTLRRDRVGFLGGTTTTPYLDELAAEGVVLANHRTCANWTTPAMACAQAGRTTLQIGFHPPTGDLTEFYDQSYPTLEHVFAAQGYRTALTSANYFFSENNGLATGFEQVVTLPYETAPGTLSVGLDNLRVLVPSGEPFYQHVHLVDPHSPYTASEEWYGDTAGLPELQQDLSTEAGVNTALRAYEMLDEGEREDLVAWFDLAYQADIRAMDQELREFLVAARDIGALENTLVVFWSDHGEQLWEDEVYGHGRMLHDEETDGLALFWMADQGLVPGVWTGPTSGLDLPPTLMTLMELPVSEDYMGSAVGLAPEDRRRMGIHLQEVEAQLSLEKEEWKLIYHWHGEVELFDRSIDPSEEEDLAAQEPEVAQELYTLLRPRILELAELRPDLPAPGNPGL